MTKLSDYVFDFVAAQGVKHVFMLPGGGAMHLVDSLGRCGGIDYVCNLHEQACAIAADAYSQYTNNLGAVLVTTGPGGTNTITGLTASWLDSVPVLYLSGQVKRADLMTGLGIRQMGFQEVDIISLVKSVTKYAVTVTEPETIRYHLEKAVYLAQNDRKGPVWLDIPLDVQAAEINVAALQGFTPPSRTSGADDLDSLRKKVAQTIEMLNQAERPVILVGNGVRLAHAVDSFRELAKLLNIPCLTTWRAMDFLAEDDPLYIGRPGAVGQRAANFAQQNADFILILGARLDLGQTGYNHKHFAPAAQKVMVDIDVSEINKLNMVINLAVPADAADFIRLLLEEKHLLALKARASWWACCREWKERYPITLPEYHAIQDGVSTYALIDALSETMTRDDLLIPGSSGTCAEVTMQAFRVKEGMRILNSPALGAMGFGIPAAIGGCLASDRKRTVCVDGDGGFQMNIQELETVRRLNLPIKFFILNNQGYASIRATQDTHFSGRYVACNEASGLTLPKSVNIARAYGIHSATLTGHDDMRQQIAELLDFDGPIICDVEITPGQCTAPRLSSRQEADGSMVSCPLEDLWPFLDREEFQKNMRVKTDDR